MAVDGLDKLGVQVGKYFGKSRLQCRHVQMTRRAAIASGGAVSRSAAFSKARPDPVAAAGDDIAQFRMRQDVEIVISDPGQHARGHKRRIDSSGDKVSHLRG